MAGPRIGLTFLTVCILSGVSLAQIFNNQLPLIKIKINVLTHSIESSWLRASIVGLKNAYPPISHIWPIIRVVSLPSPFVICVMVKMGTKQNRHGFKGKDQHKGNEGSGSAHYVHVHAVERRFSLLLF